MLRSPAFRRLPAVDRWIMHEMRSQVALPTRTKLSSWRRGFFAESALLYGFPRTPANEYLSDFHYVWMENGWINGWEELYNHKLALRTLLLAWGHRQPETVAYLYGRRILGNPLGSSARSITSAELTDYLLGSGPGARFIVKPESGSRGEGVFLVQNCDGRLYAQRGPEPVPFDLDEYLREIERAAKRRGRWPPQGIVVERHLQQAAFWRDLFPESTNTIRVLTLWHPSDPSPFIARAVQRIGTRGTVPTDNFSGGGITTPIDPTTGRLGPGVRSPFPENTSPPTLCSHHPETNALIEGAVLPDWSRIADYVLKVAAALPFNAMAGWDVLVDDDGTPVILEANGNSGVHALQAAKGLLADPPTRRFYEAVGVLRGNPRRS